MGPPPIPKGTPHPLTKAIRPGSIPSGKVWVQGKLRDKASKAANHQRQIDERRAERILRRPFLGQKIYAYNHIRTNQVVYSLTRFLEDEKILPQLLYHGKKTVPASIRKDLWTPFFCVEFPTPKHGLVAYKQLRELSALRQLAPPDSMITNSEESFNKFNPFAKYDPNLDAKKLPEGHIMPKRQRAKVLMDQKASSVADVALVLELQDRINPSKSKPLLQGKGPRVPKRVLRAMQRRTAALDQLKRQYQKAVQYVQNPEVPFSEETRVRIAAELGGIFKGNGGLEVGQVADSSLQAAAGSGQASPRILWVEPGDSRYVEAQKWPSAVRHWLLNPKAIFKATFEENLDGGQKLFVKRRVGSSVHVVGYELSEELLQGSRTPKIKQPFLDDKPSTETRTRHSKAGDVDAHVDSAVTVEPPPKSLGTRVADAVMFWKR